MPTLIGINFLGTKNRTNRWVSNLNLGVPGDTTMKKPKRYRETPWSNINWVIKFNWYGRVTVLSGKACER